MNIYSFNCVISLWANSFFSRNSSFHPELLGIATLLFFSSEVLSTDTMLLLCWLHSECGFFHSNALASSTLSPSWRCGLHISCALAGLGSGSYFKINSSEMYYISSKVSDSGFMFKLTWYFSTSILVAGSRILDKSLGLMSNCTSDLPKLLLFSIVVLIILSCWWNLLKVPIMVSERKSKSELDQIIWF